MKTIKIKRHFNLVEMQQEDPSVKAWLGESYRPIGPYYEPGGKSTATGLSFEEQRIIMPEVLGIEKTDKDFRKAVIKFFDELLTNVPKEGLELKISLQNDDLPLSETNLPIEVRDYIVYRHLLKHPHVGVDKADAERNITRRFYIEDPNKAFGEALKINKLEDQAVTVYFKYKDDDIRVDQILTMMGVNIRNLKKDDKILKLRDFTKTNPKFNENEQKEYFNRFIAVCEDKDLAIKYLIEELIGAQYLQRIGESILVKETGERIGDSMEEAVLYVTNAKHTRFLNQLKAQYHLKIRKGVFDLPTVDAKSTKEAE